MAALTLAVFVHFAGTHHAAAFERNSFAGNAVESGDWSQLCIEKDGEYPARNEDGDNPFARCPPILAKKADAAADSCQRQCEQETSDCVAVVGRPDTRPNICFDYSATCLSRCRASEKGE